MGVTQIIIIAFVAIIAICAGIEGRKRFQSRKRTGSSSNLASSGKMISAFEAEPSETGRIRVKEMLAKVGHIEPEIKSGMNAPKNPDEEALPDPFAEKITPPSPSGPKKH